MPVTRLEFSGIGCAGIALLAALIQAPLFAQSPGSWYWALVTNNGPQARAYPGLAYDSTRQRSVLFGGYTQPSNTAWQDTWELDGNAWIYRTSGGPGRRSGHAMVYDDQRARTVLFGGRALHLVPVGDTWEWDGSNWAGVGTSGPTARYLHAMAYDSLRNRTVLFGGLDVGSLALGDTWEWNGSSWTQVASAGPAARWGHAMAYDGQRAKTVLFGGSTSLTGNRQNDTWEWNGGAWTLVNTTGPGARRGHAMAYDSRRARTVLFGGDTPAVVGDTWAWDGNAWNTVTNSGPPVRRHHGMVYDDLRERVVSFGGLPGTGAEFGDTWDLSTTHASFSRYGAGCLGSSFTQTPCGELNPAGGNLAGTLLPLEVAIPVSVGAIQVQGFEIFTRSTGGTQVIQAHIYPSLGTTPLASTTMTVGPQPGFYTATFPTPVPVGNCMIAIDVSSQNVFVPNLASGCWTQVYTRWPASPSWTPTPSLCPAWKVHCVGGTVYLVPAIDSVGAPRLGATYDITLRGALPSTGAIAFVGLSDTVFQGTPLPAPLPNAPNCSILAAPHATSFTFTSATGTASYSIAVPNAASYIGVVLFHQWAVLDAANPLGIVVSDAGRAWLGT